MRHRPPAWVWPHRLRVLVRPFTSMDQLLSALYVATDLHHHQVPAQLAAVWSVEVTMPGPDGRLRIFRRLDLAWLTWIARRMAAAEAKARPEVRDAYRERFAAIRDWSIDRWGDRAHTAMQAFPDARYRAPAAA